MRVAVMYGPGEVGIENRPEPQIQIETDAIIRLAASCVCGSDLWPYRGIGEHTFPAPMGHEYLGTVVAVGSTVTTIAVGDFVVGSFFASDNTCEVCLAGYHTSCIHREPAAASGAQADLMRVPLADGTLVRTPGVPDSRLIPHLLAASDVLGTGWFAADAAGVLPGSTVAVVGDGAVGLLGVLAAREMGADRIIAMSRHADRQALAEEFGATDIVTSRGNEGAADIRRLTNGGADAVIEAVGTEEALSQAVASVRPGGGVGYVGVPHDARMDAMMLFFSHARLHGGPAPVRRYLPDLIDRIWRGAIEPGRVFDLALPLDDVAEAYRAMDQRRAIKAFLELS